MRKIAKRALRKLGDLLLAQQPQFTGPVISHPERVDGLSQASVDPTARLYVRTGSAESVGRLRLGRGAYIGRQVELVAPSDGCLSVGRNTSIQDFTIIHGHVRIGDHCLFSMNIMISSTIHRFRDRPEWLIHDQDLVWADRRHVEAGNGSDPIIVEDDCWVGWNVVVMPGVYIGRGAIIGANCVVTKDVGPYEIHGGVPNKCIGNRLSFEPPARIDALEDAAIPFFYRGFLLSQRSLQESRVRGVVDALPSACIVLAESHASELQLRGVCLDGENELRLRVSVSGKLRGDYSVEVGPFTLDIKLDGEISEEKIPSALRPFSYITIEQVNARGQVADGGNVARYGISSAELRV